MLGRFDEVGGEDGALDDDGGKLGLLDGMNDGYNEKEGTKEGLVDGSEDG